MSLLVDNSISVGDIHDYLEVLSYTNTMGRDLTVLSKVEIGSISHPIAGNGYYELKAVIDGAEVLPSSSVRVTSQQYVTVQSRHLALLVGQTLVVYVKGQAGDTAVDVESVIVDVTPVLASDLSGTGTIPVDHNYGGTDALKIVDQDNAGIQDATITAYLAADYNAGNRTVNYVRGRATTSVSGRWRAPLSLDAGNYVLVIAKPPEYHTVTHNLTVSS